MIGFSYNYQDVFKLDQMEIWRWILGPVELYQKITSPFRPDTHPNCNLVEYDGVIFFKDWNNKIYNTYTCVHAVAHLAKTRLNEAASIICNKFLNGIDYNLYIPPIEKSKELANKGGSEIQFSPFLYKGKPGWTKRGAKYWKLRGLNSETLGADNCDVYDIHHLLINGKKIKPKKYPVFAYHFTDTYSTKIYQPTSKKFKWLSNTDVNDIWKWTNFPPSDVCIITKSFKDGNILFNLLDIDIYAFQNEGVIPDDLEFLNLYEKVYLLYDNTDHERLNAIKIANQIGAINLFYKVEDGKDTDEVLLNKGNDYLFDYLNNLL